MNQKIITDLLTSEDLKNKIEETNHKFTEHELVLIAEDYAETINDKLEKLLYLAENLTEEDERNFARERAKKIEDDLHSFAKRELHTVYQVEIEDKPDAYRETYICKDYPTALITIAKFCAEYEVTFNEFSHIQIRKRAVFADSPDFDNDELGGVLLNENLLPTFVWNKWPPENDEDYSEPIIIETAKYPNFLKPYSPVKFKDYYGYRYGLQIEKLRDDEYDDAFVIFLDTEQYDSESLEDFDYPHIHIPIPKVVQLELKDLPDKEQKNCEKLIAYLKSEQLI